MLPELGILTITHRIKGLKWGRSYAPLRRILHHFSTDRVRAILFLQIGQNFGIL